MLAIILPQFSESKCLLTGRMMYLQEKNSGSFPVPYVDVCMVRLYVRFSCLNGSIVCIVLLTVYFSNVYSSLVSIVLLSV